MFLVADDFLLFYEFWLCWFLWLDSRHKYLLQLMGICCVQEELVRDNLANFTEMCEGMERRHRHELQELRESYEGWQSCVVCAVLCIFVDFHRYVDRWSITAGRRFLVQSDVYCELQFTQ